MKTADFDFELPPELIAQVPLPGRDQSRMLVLHRHTGGIEHRQFRDLVEYLQAGDVVVLNNSRVIPARLRGANARTEGKFEILLLEENGMNDWWVMLRPGKRARVGAKIRLLDLQGRATPVEATVIETNEEGHRRLRFEAAENILAMLERIGEVPLPPYIRRPIEGEPGINDSNANSFTETKRAASQQLDRERYQTVFSRITGSVAAPTAGLHFTEAFLEQIRARGVEVCFVTLHVGLGTFAPVKAELLSEHVMHEERYEVSAGTAETINKARRERRRIIAVGTTTLRVLETLGQSNRDGSMREPGNESDVPAPQGLRAGHGRTRIFIHPPYRFNIVDALLTNFHLPRSTLLMLASAFAAPGETRGREVVLSAYAEAIRLGYRFFSYGDAMLVV